MVKISYTENDQYYQKYKQYKAKYKSIKKTLRGGIDNDSNKRFAVGTIVAVIKNGVSERGTCRENNQGVRYIDLTHDRQEIVTEDSDSIQFVEIPSFYQY